MHPFPNRFAWLTVMSLTLWTAGSGSDSPAQIASSLTVAATTRPLVIAPHPDDEVLGAGGLLQQVRAAGGRVHVVYLTDGDGFPEGVQSQHGLTAPDASDYQGYGRRRRREAQAALSALGLAKDASTFLSFPDGGLSNLMTEYWSERGRTYRSPYTRLDRPTTVVVTRQEDQHPDHCAASFFVADALRSVSRVEPAVRVDVLAYIVHFNEWPFQDDGPTLAPPPGLSGGTSGWISLLLTADQLRHKRAALTGYRTQVRVMGWFLAGFVRHNELFSRPTSAPHLLPVRPNPCTDR